MDLGRIREPFWAPFWCKHLIILDILFERVLDTMLDGCWEDLGVHVKWHERIEDLVRILLELHDTLELGNLRVVRLALDGELTIFRGELEDFVVRRVDADLRGQASRRRHERL